MALIYCSSCGRQISDQATACPQCGHPIRPRRRLLLAETWLLLALIGLGFLRYALVKSGSDAEDFGAAIGSVIGPILFAGLIYLLVRAIRGKARTPRTNRFILITALVLASISLVQRIAILASEGQVTSSPTNDSR